MSDLSRLFVALIMTLPASASAQTLASLEFPGTPEFVAAAKSIAEVRIALKPGDAAGAGLYDDSAAVPSFAPKTVSAHLAKVRAALSALRMLDWRSWDVDRQIDFRWVYLQGEALERMLGVDKRWEHRAAEWLEPVSDVFISLLTYAPDRRDILDAVVGKLPGMVAEMRELIKTPTRQDNLIAAGVLEGLVEVVKGQPESKKRTAALAAFADLKGFLESGKDLPEYRVVGRESYEWILKNRLMLPWNADQLLSVAEKQAASVEAELAGLAEYKTRKPEPTQKQKALAKSLDRDSFLGLYDTMVESQFAFLREADLLTVPAGVGPIRARETPKSMIPLTGDGGSMSPTPALSNETTAYWNVENFRADWSEQHRLNLVVGMQDYAQTDMGPYSVHEGVPGHHLQLSVARLNPNPLRKLFYDDVMVEGWALYAEEIFRAAGGYAGNKAGDYHTLDSWLFRIRRVVYDVNIETGKWTVQEGADWKHRAKKGEGKVDPDVLRTVNWPTQLISYFCGKMQLLELKAAYKKKLGAAYSDRKFHDAVLEVGSLPLVFARAKLLGEAVPGLDP